MALSADIEITRSGEFMVLHIQGMNDRGVDFVDEYVPKVPAELYVVDAGRIILPEHGYKHLAAKARERGLTVKEKVAP